MVGSDPKNKFRDGVQDLDQESSRAIHARRIDGGRLGLQDRRSHSVDPESWLFQTENQLAMLSSSNPGACLGKCIAGVLTSGSDRQGCLQGENRWRSKVL
jgi:hypothetical protein